MDIYDLAEKYTARKLKEVCSEFIVTNIDIANTVLRVNAENIHSQNRVIKKDMIVRCNRSTVWWTDSNTGISSTWHFPLIETGYLSELKCKAGSIGRIIDASDGIISVKWDILKARVNDVYSYSYKDIRGDISHLDILTPPINTKLFKD